MKLNRRNRQTIDQALAILAQVQAAQDHQADQVDGPHEISPSTIEAALRRNVWKEMPVILPATE